MEFVIYQKPVFLLYGKAGVGKSSVTSHIICRTILGKNCHAAMLRKYADKLSYKNAWESVKNIYECSDDNFYRGRVLILDGLDEVCVLKQGFDGKAFIEDLTDNIPNGIKILITSRNYEGYFSKVEDTNDLTIDTITWTNIQVKEWCDKYSDVHKCKKNWCNEFIRKYNGLNDDKRKEIFCIPIILYICCVCEIDIAEHSSVAGIYDAAFKKIGGREHSRRNRNSELKKADESLIDVNWQYTKELAFQMFLNDKLESALDNNLIKTAKTMTAKFCKTTESNIRIETDRYHAFFHFISKSSEGIEFVHKTVGEYFTAVKLYEDYFANTLADMSEESVEDMWRNIFQAFRYKKIPEDIMQYFAELVRTRKTKDENTEEVKSYNEWRDCFIDSYYKGMQEQLLWKMTTQKTDYVSKENYFLSEQVSISFRNLTWLLTMIGFNNSYEESNNYNYKHILESYIVRSIKIDVNLIFWKNLKEIKFDGVDLSYSKLNYADLREAYLIGTQLTGANLNNVHLNKANLRNANLNNANLNKAYLTEVNLRGAHLYNADLTYADLTSADLTSADLNNANLGDAILSNVNLTGANLIYTNLNGANLTNANLTNVKLVGSDSFDIVILNIHLLESDLPKFDEFTKNKKVTLYDPIIEDVDMTKHFYDPETNRIRPK